MELVTDRLRIRPFTFEDLDAYANIVADPVVMRFLGGTQTLHDAETHLLASIELFETGGLGRYAVTGRVSSEFLGFCGYVPGSEYIDLGYGYTQASWGRGIGLEAALAVRKHGLDELGLKNVEAGASRENPASLRILDRLGFQHREDVIFEGEPAVRYWDE